MIADVAMVLQAESVTNTGYLAAGGTLAIESRQPLERPAQCRLPTGS
jgi:hypothetical protein